MPTLWVISVSMWEECSTRASRLDKDPSTPSNRCNSFGQNPRPGQGLDVAPEGLLGGYPARRGMWLGQVAFLAQVCHYIPDRGRAEAVAAPFGNGARGYRFATLDIGTYNRVQDFGVPGCHGRSLDHNDKAEVHCPFSLIVKDLDLTSQSTRHILSWAAIPADKALETLMPSNAYQNYFQNEVLTATPL